LAVRRQAALVSRAANVHRIPPRVRDDREPPLLWDGTGRISELIWVRLKQKYFCKRGLTRFRKNRSDLPGRLDLLNLFSKIALLTMAAACDSLQQIGIGNVQ
jgi:hypothetical protein